MAIEKTRAYVLKTLPYRESSGIFYLLTERQGVLHGIAKGIRKKKATASFLERGFLIETLIYSKPHRELHTLGDIHMMEYFPRTRSDLIKGAIRDTAFETVLASVSTGYPYPELFHLTALFLATLEKRSFGLPPLLWKFHVAFSKLMGFGMNSDQCVACKKPLSRCGGDVFLVIEKGGFTCEECAAISAGDSRGRVSETIRHLLFSHDFNALPVRQSGLSQGEMRRMTHLFASYCQYHCDTRSEYKALEFLDSLLI